MTLRPLLESVVALHVDVGAPPRLMAHHRVVHDVACRLTEWLGAEWPEFRFDADAVRFGAATHDIGKALHPRELTGPGSSHEPDGHALLIERGVPEHHARYARTHNAWGVAGTTIEDQLVTLADKVWKARREADLEQRLVEWIAAVTRREQWAIFADLDDALVAVAADAERRIHFQASHAIE